MSAVKTLPIERSVTGGTKGHLLSTIGSWFGKLNDSNEFTAIYVLRNKEEVVVPFLDSLETPYLKLSQELILVETSAAIQTKLQKLKFASLGSICPSGKTYQAVIGKTHTLFVDRLYQKDYGIEIFLVNKSDWHNIRLTVAICKELKIKAGNYYDTFIKIYTKLKDHHEGQAT